MMMCTFVIFCFHLTQSCIPYNLLVISYEVTVIVNSLPVKIKLITLFSIASLLTAGVARTFLPRIVCISMESNCSPETVSSSTSSCFSVVQVLIVTMHDSNNNYNKVLSLCISPLGSEPNALKQKRSMKKRVVQLQPTQIKRERRKERRWKKRRRQPASEGIHKKR